MYNILIIPKPYGLPFGWLVALTLHHLDKDKVVKV